MAVLRRNAKQIFPDTDWNLSIKNEREVLIGRLGYE
jgi:hypothetical protein